MAAFESNSPLCRIDVVICTFRRSSVEETLCSVARQQLPEGVSLRIIVADNDETTSAATHVEAAERCMSVPVVYVHAPARNISIARNACLDIADGDWIAFIDDDEAAAPDWLARLRAYALDNRCDGVFGPAVATYGDDSPYWISAVDYHSNRPVSRFGEVQTGHTCNALLRWRGGPFDAERFRLDKGRSGGEDTEFFFRLWRNGARLGICEEALVFERVDPARLSFDWIRRRKFRAGQSYGRHARAAPLAQAGLAAAAFAKIASCAAMAGLTAWSETRRRYWMLRGVFHSGVLAAQFGVREEALYGE